jgi:hypothetical protein
MFSSYKRKLLSLTLRIKLLTATEHGELLLKHILVGFSFRYQFARIETDRGLRFVNSSIRRPYTDEDA